MHARCLEKTRSKSVLSVCAIRKRSLCRNIMASPIHCHSWIVQGSTVSIYWMDLPSAPDGILEVVNCRCVTGCNTNRCSCFKAEVPCSDICGCKDCVNVKRSGDTDGPEEENREEESDLESELSENELF